MSDQRWVGLDMFEALAAESYWLEFTKLNQKTRIELLASIAQTATAKQSILDLVTTGTNITDAIDKVLAEQAKVAESQTAMRRLYYEQNQFASLVDDAAAEYMLIEKLSTRRIADLLKADAKTSTPVTDTKGSLRWRNGKLEYKTSTDTTWKSYTQHPLRCPDTIKDCSPGFATMQLLLRSGYTYDQDEPNYED